MKIGVIGIGMVGGAVKRWMTALGHEVFAYDTDTSRSTHVLNDVIGSELIFVCVPTLTRSDGLQELGPLHRVINELVALEFKGVVVHKCTVTPGVTRALQALYDPIRLVHYPEFLRERSAYEDLVTAPLDLLSGDTVDMKLVVDALGPNRCVVRYSRYEYTEMAKYIHNCFLATKVSFFNEVYDACEKEAVVYEMIIEDLVKIGGVGTTHLVVPGPDGKRGWGGSCFPKDTAAFVRYCDEKDLGADTLMGAIKANRRVRPVIPLKGQEITPQMIVKELVKDVDGLEEIYVCGVTKDGE